MSDLDRYAYDQRLTGVALLDGDFDIIEQSSCDGDIMESWSDMILSDNVANIAHNELKSYMTRVEKNGVVYDFAAVSLVLSCVRYDYTVRAGARHCSEIIYDTVFFYSRHV